MVRRVKKKRKKRRRRRTESPFAKEVLGLTKFAVEATVATGVGIALIDTAKGLVKK